MISQKSQTFQNNFSILVDKYNDILNEFFYYIRVIFIHAHLQEKRVSAGQEIKSCSKGPSTNNVDYFLTFFNPSPKYANL